MADRVIAYVLGGAACVWDDLAAARELCSPDITLAVNDIGIAYPHPLDYWVSYHSNMLPRWMAKRAQLNLPRAKALWTGSAKSWNAPAGIMQHKNRGGSSGMLAACVAIDDGHATHTILIGVPMDVNMAHFHDRKRGQPWKDGRNYKHHWQMKVPEFKGKVKSMSGWTAELLGKPTKEWLENADA